MNPSPPENTINNNNNQNYHKPTLSRLRPSIAQSIIRPQNISPNIFSATNKKLSPNNQNTKPSTFSNFLSSTFQLPLAIPQIAALGLAIASGNQGSMDHQHHNHDHSSSPVPEPEAMRRCSMNMIFNTKPIGTCIVFREFYISGTVALIFYWILLFLIAIGYEYLRLASQRYDRMVRVRLSGVVSKRSNPSSPRRVSSNENLIADSSTVINPKVQAWGQISVPRSIQLTRSFFYISNVTLSFFLMLVIMTYNAQIILAVLAGAFVGHFIFHREISFGEPDKGMACH